MPENGQLDTMKRQAMAKKTIKARIENIELKVGKRDDAIQVWMTDSDGMTTYTAPDGTKITMTQEEFDAKYPDAIKVGYGDDDLG